MKPSFWGVVSAAMVAGAVFICWVGFDFITTGGSSPGSREAAAYTSLAMGVLYLLSPEKCKVENHEET